MCDKVKTYSPHAYTFCSNSSVLAQQIMNVRSVDDSFREQRLWLDSVDAHGDLRLCCSYIPFFLQSVVEWSTEKYAAVFNSFSDNVAGKSFRERYVCLFMAGIISPLPEVKEKQTAFGPKSSGIGVGVDTGIGVSKTFSCLPNIKLVMLVNQFFPKLQENFTGTCLKAD